MSTEGNKALARRIVEEMWNTRNLAVIDEIYAPAEDGHEEVRTRVSSYLSAFPDLHVTIDGQTAEGDWVATRFSSNGTHLGALFGVPATGERTAAAGVVVHRFADGKLVDLWNCLDLTGVLRHLGSVSNRRVVRRWYEEYVNGHDVAVLDTLATDDFRSHFLSGAEGRSRAELKMIDGALYSAIPDLALTVQDLVAEGDRVAVRYAYRGTHLGDALGVLPTGNELTGTGMDIFRIADGRIAERWAELNFSGLMRSLGVPAG